MRWVAGEVDLGGGEAGSTDVEMSEMYAEMEAEADAAAALPSIELPDEVYGSSGADPLPAYPPSPPSLPVYIVGRSMFETSAVPSDWVTSCNYWVDEVRRFPLQGARVVNGRPAKSQTPTSPFPPPSALCTGLAPFGVQPSDVLRARRRSPTAARAARAVRSRAFQPGRY